jgi:hypothetical protein
MLLYNIIKKESEVFLNLLLNPENVDASDLILPVGFPQWIHKIVQLFVLLLILLLSLIFGVLLWNNGLVAVMPNVLRPMGSMNQRLSTMSNNNEYIQLILTMSAIILLF